MPMQLVADSGSTKTVWQWIAPGGAVHEARTAGINPYYLGASDIEAILTRELVPALAVDDVATHDVMALFFYGAGCSLGARQALVREAMARSFPQASIAVESDLLGAARALCGHSAGIVCVLGTGSGSCYYDGSVIAATVPSLGFILGDEGGGAHIGKKIVTAFLRGELPPAVAWRLQDDLAITKEVVLDRVNRGPMPSRYLAGFARFASEQQDDPYVRKVIYDSFSEFVEHYVMRYDGKSRLPVHVVGSVAFHNLAILQAVARDRGFVLGNVLASPIDALRAFHQPGA